MQSIVHRDCVICEGRLADRPGLPARTCESPQCRMRYQRHLQEGRPTCFACGRPLAVHQSSGESAHCGRLECLNLSRRFPSWPVEHRCRFCRVPLIGSRNETGVCDDRDCRVVYSTRQAEERAIAKREAFRAQIKRTEQLRNELAEFHGLPNAGSHTPVAIAYFRDDLKPLPAHRREELRSHLASQVEAFKERPPVDGESGDNPPAANPWPDVGPEGERLTGRVCAHCRGYCCQQGGTHAFVSADTIGSLLERRPEVEVDQVVDEYLNQLPETSYDGSCVFHSETGCALPHDMRAATCGLFYCWGQQELRAALEQGAAPLAFVALATEKGEVVEGAFLDGAAHEEAAG